MSGLPLWVPLAAGLLALGILARASWSMIVRASPDEWLLQIRDGALVRSGIGITAIQWPYDRLVRFPASVQRVRFQSEALSSELMAVSVEAFALWSVSPGDPLLAARRLGLASARSSRDQHLLSRPQYHAFQQALSSMVRRHAGQFTLAELCRDPAPLAEAVLRDAEREFASLGAQVEGVSIIEARPSDRALLMRLSAEVDEEISRQAARAQDETARERDRLSAAASLARQRAQIDVEQQIAAEQERLAEIRRAHAATALTAELSLARQRAQIEAEILTITASAEATRSAELRAYDLAKRKTEVLGQTLQSWPVQSAQWVGLEGPIAAVERILQGALPLNRVDPPREDA